MGCTHCLVNSAPKGSHITPAVFCHALDVAVELGDPYVALSGGEPTEHPRIVELIREASNYFPLVAVVSNGMWLHHRRRTAELLATEAQWQITNDPRFYPRRLPEGVLGWELPNVTFVEHVSTLQRLGRYRGESNRKAPCCFNLRSLTRQFGSFVLAVTFLRYTHKFCTPSVDVDGTIRAGESTECYPLGTIWSTEAELTAATLAHDCDRCGLHSRLTPNLREAVA